MEHELKILPQYFKAVQEGTKTFELRKHDRWFWVGDTLVLKEFYPKYGEKTNYYTGNEIKKEISYILEGGQYGLEEGYCILGLKQEDIQLKNINLEGITLTEQYKKIEEEEKEFSDSLLSMKYDNEKETYYLDIDHVIEEFYDTIQAKLGLLNMFGISADEVMKHYLKHLEKLENRPRTKKCSKCINSQNTKEKGLICDKDLETIGNEDYAKTCGCYEEQED